MVVMRTYIICINSLSLSPPHTHEITNKSALLRERKSSGSRSYFLSKQDTCGIFLLWTVNMKQTLPVTRGNLQEMSACPGSEIKEESFFHKIHLADCLYRHRCCDFRQTMGHFMWQDTKSAWSPHAVNSQIRFLSTWPWNTSHDSDWWPSIILLRVLDKMCNTC